MSHTSGVTSSPLLHTLLTQTEATGQARSARPSAGGAIGTQDSAQLSTTASALQAGGVDDVERADKVRSVQAAIANGTYNVSADAVADKLMQSLLQR